MEAGVGEGRICRRMLVRGACEGVSGKTIWDRIWFKL